MKLKSTKQESGYMVNRWILILNFVALLSACATVTTEVCISEPNMDVINEMLTEVNRAEAGERLVFPHTYIWHKEVFRDLGWSEE
jgi:hypothetical protein